VRELLQSGHGACGVVYTLRRFWASVGFGGGIVLRHWLLPSRFYVANPNLVSKPPSRMVIFAQVSTTQRAIADAAPFDDYHAHVRYWDGMDAEQTIAEIETLERIFSVPDPRPLSPSDLSAANRRHDEMLAHSPWFRLWQRYGVCSRGEAGRHEF